MAERKGETQKRERERKRERPMEKQRKRAKREKRTNLLAICPAIDESFTSVHLRKLVIITELINRPIEKIDLIVEVDHLRKITIGVARPKETSDFKSNLNRKNRKCEPEIQSGFDKEESRRDHFKNIIIHKNLWVCCI